MKILILYIADHYRCHFIDGCIHFTYHNQKPGSVKVGMGWNSVAVEPSLKSNMQHALACTPNDRHTERDWLWAFLTKPPAYWSLDLSWCTQPQVLHCWFSAPNMYQCTTENSHQQMFQLLLFGQLKVKSTVPCWFRKLLYLYLRMKIYLQKYILSKCQKTG